MTGTDRQSGSSARLPIVHIAAATDDEPLTEHISHLSTMTVALVVGQRAPGAFG